jgi:8-oxo-dGTP pyrophosphatase MutT (NUDIX family)
MKDTGFERHVRACNNASLPGDRVGFFVGDQPVGWIAGPIASALDGMAGIRSAPDRVVLTDPAALPAIVRVLAERGLCRLRGELFDVRATADGPALAKIDRGAIPSFGIEACGVHVNGLVRRSDGAHLWIARRASDRLLDPGKLDHIVAGGIPAGLDPARTLIKEAAEEAAVPAELAGKAVPVGVISYVMERAEGLRRDRLYCYDLVLPEDFVPEATDGEVEAFELWPLTRVAEVVRDTDDFKFNVNLVLIDLFIRKGLIAGAEAARLRLGLERGEGGQL